ncbi:MAG: class I SAM-dependent methyltransferase [Desulfobacterales bacterium]|nr:class I SAM-dependent methyltransferase [Desulfobacterales bacterium]
MRDQSRGLAQSLGLPDTDVANLSFAFLLVRTKKRLELRRTGPSAPGPLFVDFIRGPLGYRHRHGGGNKQFLARAVGIKRGRRPAIIDVTAGLGRDAFILAGLGCRVRMIERSPILAALVKDGLKRAAADPKIFALIQERLLLTVGDSLELLPRLAAENRPQVIYLDPMYPHRGKSALVKKEMRMIRGLVGDDPDAPALLAAALRLAADRVVVKRPLAAPPLAGTPAVSTVITGKTMRYDIYLTPVPASGNDD